jgi:formate hydrogenlyase subunit 3/multisubunit Na+/H+ antiporter MnhD subunit
VSHLALSALAVLLAGFGAAGIAAAWRRAWAAPLSAGLCAAGAVVTFAALLDGAAPASLALPVGLPGLGMTLAFDGLSGFFLLLLFVAGGAAAVAAADGLDEYGATAPFLPVFLGAMALSLLAADGFSLLLGFELMSLASFALVLTTHREAPVRSAALLYVGMAAFGAVCLLACLAVIAQGGRAGIDLRFAALRAHAPEGWRAAVVVALALAGAGSKAGLAPLHVWLPPAHAAAPGHVSALMSGVMTKMALYVLIRILFDLAGPVPGWAAVPLLALGAGGAVLGALRANLEGDIKAILACSTVENIGLITAGLGLAVAARAADLPGIASLAAGAALLHAFAHGMFKPLLFLGAGAIQHGAGTRRLDRLGGLIHRMPVTCGCVMLGAACLAGLPPTAGFAGEWALFQAVLAAPRIGGLGTQIIVCVAAALMALGAALAAAAAVRLVGVALLGRPRTPRCAAAEEPGRCTRAALLGLTGAAVLVGLFPSFIIDLAGPALVLVAGAGFGERASALVLAPAADVAGYSAPGAVLLLALAAGLVWLALRRAAPGHRSAPAWDCGFGDPPAWLPFGDPATQYGGASFGQPLRRALGVALLDAREAVDMPSPGDRRPATVVASFTDPAARLIFAPLGRLRDAVSAWADAMQFLTVRASLSLMVGLLVLLLAALAIVEQS